MFTITLMGVMQIVGLTDNDYVNMIQIQQLMLKVINMHFLWMNNVGNSFDVCFPVYLPTHFVLGYSDFTVLISAIFSHFFETLLILSFPVPFIIFQKSKKKKSKLIA